MIEQTGLEIIEMFGDYAYGKFDEETSDFMIYKMTKNRARTSAAALS